jgi:hypothetical protein
MDLQTSNGHLNSQASNSGKKELTFSEEMG